MCLSVCLHVSVFYSVCDCLFLCVCLCVVYVCVSVCVCVYQCMYCVLCVNSSSKFSCFTFECYKVCSCPKTHTVSELIFRAPQSLSWYLQKIFCHTVFNIFLEKLINRFHWNDLKLTSNSSSVLISMIILILQQL